VSRQQAQKKICWDFAHALLELAVWLQAGEDRAIAAGSRADKKSGSAAVAAVRGCPLSSPNKRMNHEPTMSTVTININITHNIQHVNSTTQYPISTTSLGVKLSNALSTTSLGVHALSMRPETPAADEPRRASCVVQLAGFFFVVFFFGHSHLNYLKTSSDSDTPLCLLSGLSLITHTFLPPPPPLSLSLSLPPPPLPLSHCSSHPTAAVLYMRAFLRCQTSCSTLFN
jgi:hypothetical protein